MLQPDFHIFPELKTNMLLLRRLNSGDTASILLQRSDERILRYLDKHVHLISDERILRYLDKPKMQTEAEALDWINNVDRNLQQNEGITWGIELVNEKILIGTIGLWRMIKEHYRAEIGYMLLPAYH